MSDSTADINEWKCTMLSYKRVNGYFLKIYSIVEIYEINIFTKYLSTFIRIRILSLIIWPLGECGTTKATVTTRAAETNTAIFLSLLISLYTLTHVMCVFGTRLQTFIFNSTDWSASYWGRGCEGTKTKKHLESQLAALCFYMGLISTPVVALLQFLLSIDSVFRWQCDITEAVTRSIYTYVCIYKKKK